MRILASPAASQVVPGVLGFLVVAAMGLALFFLLRSMNKHLRKVAREPQWREEAGGQGGAGGDGPHDQPGDGPGNQSWDGPKDQPEADYSRNGTGQA